MTRIYIVRHGESLANATKKYIGRADWDLSPLGYEQAERTACELADVRIDAVYSSDLKRAYNTALPHARLRGIRVIGCASLREIDVGDWQERSFAGDDPEVLPVSEWMKSFGEFCFPGGESVKDGAERAYTAIKQIAEENDGKTVLIATHAALTCAFWCKIRALEPEDWAKNGKLPSNASYSILEYTNGSFLPIEYSHDSHLK